MLNAEDEIKRLRDGIRRFVRCAGPIPCACIKVGEGGVIYTECTCGDTLKRSDSEKWCHQERINAAARELLEEDAAC